MTKKQLQQARVETHSEMYGLLLDLDYSIDLLDDYRSDLQMTAKETTQNIKKAVSYTHLTLPTNREV